MQLLISNVFVLVHSNSSLILRPLSPRLESLEMGGQRSSGTGNSVAGTLVNDSILPVSARIALGLINVY